MVCCCGGGGSPVLVLSFEVVAAAAVRAVGGQRLRDQGVGGPARESFGKVGGQVDPHGGDDASGVGDPAPGEDERGYQGDECHRQRHHEEQRRAGDGVADDRSGGVPAVDLAPEHREDHHQHVGEDQAPEEAHQRPPQYSGHAGKQVDQAGDAEEGEAEPVDQGVDDLEDDETDFGDEHDPQGEGVVDRGGEKVVLEKLDHPLEKSPLAEKALVAGAFVDAEGVGLAPQHVHQEGVLDLLQAQGRVRGLHGGGHALVVEDGHAGEQEDGDCGTFEQPLRVDGGYVFDDECDHEHRRQKARKEEAVVLHQGAHVRGLDQKQILDHLSHSL